MNARFFATIALAAFIAAPLPALADDVTVRTTYPNRFGEHTNADTESSLTVGSLTQGASTNVFGDVSIVGDLVITKPTNGLVRIAPSHGPYQEDGLRVHPNGSISIGSNVVLPAANPPKLKSHTTLKGRRLYAYGDPADTHTVYGLMQGYLDTSASSYHLQRKALFASRPVAGGNIIDPAAGTYGPLRIDGREVQMGPQYDPNVPTGRGNPSDPWFTGMLERVIIGTNEMWLDPVDTPEPEIFLQVGHPTDPDPTDPERIPGINGAPDEPPQPTGGAASNWRVFSSREYKKDIVPFDAAAQAGALEAISRLDVVRYRFKSEPVNAKPHTGVIAEDLPAAIRSASGKGLDLGQAYSYAAAALKALKTENDVLKTRLEKLEAEAAARKARP